MTPELIRSSACSLRNNLETNQVRIAKQSSQRRSGDKNRVKVLRKKKHNKTGNRVKDEESVSCAHVLGRVRKGKAVVFIH